MSIFDNIINNTVPLKVYVQLFVKSLENISFNEKNLHKPLLGHFDPFCLSYKHNSKTGYFSQFRVLKLEKWKIYQISSYVYISLHQQDFGIFFFAYYGTLLNHIRWDGKKKHRGCSRDSGHVFIFDHM